MSSHRMFRVIVLGGVALVDCGARTDLGRHDVRDATADAGADAKEEDSGFTFGTLDATPIDVMTSGDVIFPPAEANAPPPEGDDP
jgi:hypothetical protein